MAITFRVNLETVKAASSVEPADPADRANLKNTRSTFFPDLTLNHRILKHGDEFEESGMRAIYLRDNFTSGDWKFLDVVSGSP